MYAVRSTAILNCCAAPLRTCCAMGSGTRRKNRRSIYLSENADEATIAIRDFGPGVPEKRLHGSSIRSFAWKKRATPMAADQGWGFRSRNARCMCIADRSSQKMQPPGCASRSRFRSRVKAIKTA